MFSFIKKVLNYNEWQLEKTRKKVDEINSLESRARDLKDEDFKKETERLRDLVLSKKKSLDELLPWSFALVREAARRVLGERHYDVQLIAGIGLHEGKIVEQKTGEGKTLSATTAIYLNALSGKGVHVVTVNDYLARRDAGWMGRVFHFLGLSTAAIISEESFIFDPSYSNKDMRDWRLVNLRPITRKEAYLADVTYGINSEFGFDYLRDNMAQSSQELVQREFNFAIIDEADSVLIDEARTPHIISAPYDEDVSKYYQYAKIVKNLVEEKDYVIDEKARTAHLTEEGISKVESLLHVKNIYEKDFDTVFHVEAALKAKALFKRDKDYIVKDGQVIIVDEFTGRLLYGRRFSEGLHQAIEAKEEVQIQKESRTLATISLQNYFRMYKKLAGMTGTAATEAEEFHKIYNADVLVVPTNKPVIRKDYPDMIYKTERAKFNAVVEEVAKEFERGRPVLIGTSSIEKNEYLSSLLKKKGIPHEVLNAKHHEREAQIIAQAGEKGAVTVATNMAGRGVDIILGGQPPNKYEIGMGKRYERLMGEWRKKHDEVVELGGLYVIGTERHESRRIDNQLRGRSGRQGDPGQSRFFVSLEDDLMRIFGGEQIANLMNFLKVPEDQPLTHKMVSKAIEQAQVKVEGYNFDIRKHLVEYDDVLNRQREIIYSLRRKLIKLVDKDFNKFDEVIFGIIRDEVEELVNRYFLENGEGIDDKMWNDFVKDVFLLIGEKKGLNTFKNGNKEKLIEFLYAKLVKIYKKRKEQLGEVIWSGFVKSVFLSTIDEFWTNHLTAIGDLREGINLRGYAQLDPLVEYKNEAFSMFENLMSNIQDVGVRKIFSIRLERSVGSLNEKVEKEKKEESKNLVYKSASAINPFSAQVSQPQAQGPSLSVKPVSSKRFKIGRNDPCWCGSGKKWKKCHYPEPPPPGWTPPKK